MSNSASSSGGGRRQNMREVAERAGVAVSSVSRVLSGHPDVSDEMRERVESAVVELGYRTDSLVQPRERRQSSREVADMREVAERAGVAVSSVSRVLSGHPDVSDEMRERVESTVAELGYRPDLLARSMRRLSTMTCGIVVNDVTNPLFARMVTGAESALRTHGYSVLLTSTNGEPARDVEAIRLFDQRRVDGLLLALASETHGPTLEALRSGETPTVLLDREVPDDLPVGRVISQHEVGMREAVEHLVGLGHRRICMVAGDTLRPSTVRVGAFEAAAAAAAAGAEGEVIAVPTVSEPGAGAAVADVLGRPQPPTALVVGGNQLLLGALEAIRERGLRLGSDLSLVSCDETQLTRLYDPAIAVVARDLTEIGRSAATLLHAQMSGEAPPTTPITLGTSFIARPSCGPPVGA